MRTYKDEGLRARHAACDQVADLWEGCDVSKGHLAVHLSGVHEWGVGGPLGVRDGELSEEQLGP